MQSFEVGQIISEFAIRRDEIKFDADSAGGIFIVLLNGISSEEIVQFRSGSRAEFGLFEHNNTMFVLSKFGDMEWMDSPYCPALSKERIASRPIITGSGLAVTVVLADSSTGQIVNLRLVSWSTQMTTRLYEYVIDYPDAPPADYNAKIAETYAAYSTKKMVAMASVRYKMHG